MTRQESPATATPARPRALRAYMRRIPLLLFAALLVPLSAGLAQSPAEQEDAKVIAELRRAGSDVSKPHDIDFFLYFPDPVRAEAAAEDLRALGYAPAPAEKLPGPGDWRVHATRRMVPRLEAMMASTRDLEALAARHEGDYDGWGTSVVH